MRLASIAGLALSVFGSLGVAHNGELSMFGKNRDRNCNNLR